jgi:hypothetical protein
VTCYNCKLDMVKCQHCGQRFQEPQEKPFGADERLPRTARSACRRSCEAVTQKLD